MVTGGTGAGRTAAVDFVPSRAGQVNGGRLVTTVIAVVAALLAAFCFAVAALVQQTVARATAADEAMHPRLLLDLARRPRWLAGIGLDAMSFLILAVALAFGPLALVQPLASVDVLFALPLIARLQGRRAHRWGRLARRPWSAGW